MTNQLLVHFPHQTLVELFAPGVLLVLDVFLP
jgi:hypothetical protein